MPGIRPLGEQQIRIPTPQVEKEESVSNQRTLQKPMLERPVGLFCSYFALEKLVVHSESASVSSVKEEIEQLDQETTQAHRAVRELKKNAIKKGNQSKNWGIATKVFSWIASVVSVVTGAAMVATGVGAVAGSLLIAAGTIQIVNQLLEVTGGWKKIANALPGDDDEKKQAIIAWMQIGITVLCMVISGVGAVFGGFANIAATVGTAMSMVGGVVNMGQGATTLGHTVTESAYFKNYAKVREREVRLTQLKGWREESMNTFDELVERLGQTYEMFATMFGFLREMQYAENRAWGR